MTSTINPIDATNKDIKWTSTDDSIATVDNVGKILAVSAGKATISVTTVDGNKVDACEVSVSNPVIHPTSISLNKTSDTLTVGDTDNLSVTIAPIDALNKDISWESSDVSIATVDNNGKVEAISAGTAIITAITNDGNKRDTCTVVINNPVINVASISLNKNTDSMIVGDTDTLNATVAPNDANNQAATWTSSDTSIATVDNTGNVTAVNYGTAVITATSVDGNKTANCTVTVNSASSKDYSFTISGNTATITGYTGVGGDITIPNNINGCAVTNIGIFAFDFYSNLDSVTIPDSVTYIGEFAFESSSITSVNIPASVTCIDTFAFDYCDNLKTIYVNATNAPSMGFCVFYDAPTTAVLYIPTGSQGYNCAPWTQFRQFTQQVGGEK